VGALLAEQGSKRMEPAFRAKRRPLAWLPYALAAAFALWSLRGASNLNIADTDAARHFMNGAFLHDLIASGRVMHPIQFGKEYYGHLPALSMPYHPPLFPGIESLFFLVFGVKLLAARAVVALTVGISVVLFYRLLRATHGSDLLAACVTISLFSLWISQLVATSVMLEYPSLVFTLAALYCVRDFDEGYPLGRALLFAVFAAAAVWTKQFAVFLGAVPPVCALFQRRWRVLFGKAMWISSALFACAVVALMSLSAPFHGAGVSQVPAESHAITAMLKLNLVYYGPDILTYMAGLPGVFTVCAAASLVWLVYKGAWRRLNLGLYVAWAVLPMPILLLLYYDDRYFFILFPGLITIGFVLMFRAGALVFGERRAWMTPVAFASAWLIAGLFFQPEYLRGPAEAAAIVVRADPARVLYAGDADGNFIAAVRMLEPRLETSVIPGEKLPPDTFHAAAFESFCHRYGVGWIVLEKSSGQEVGAAENEWAGLLASPTPSMKLERSIPLASSRPRWRGTVEVYRFVSAAAKPEGGLELHSNEIGGQVEAEP